MIVQINGVSTEYDNSGPNITVEFGQLPEGLLDKMVQQAAMVDGLGLSAIDGELNVTYEEG